MLALFCLRLALGLIGSLVLLSPAQVNPRFYRTHFLTALGLAAVAAAVAGVIGSDRPLSPWLWAALAGAMLLSLLGSATWSLEGAPGGRVLIALTALALAAALVGLEWAGEPPAQPAWVLAGAATAAALLGAATTAMLMGHSYLIAPAMSIAPLMRLLAALAVAALLRTAVAAAGLWCWTAEHSLTNLNDVTVFLPVRWGLGLVAPLVLTGMAWQTARIRSTQSATGILYVAVIFCFLGELTAQLLGTPPG